MDFILRIDSLLMRGFYLKNRFILRIELKVVILLSFFFLSFFYSLTVMKNFNGICHLVRRNDVHQYN